MQYLCILKNRRLKKNNSVNTVTCQKQLVTISYRILPVYHEVEFARQLHDGDKVYSVYTWFRVVAPVRGIFLSSLSVQFADLVITCLKSFR